jgi:DNA-binding protein HU-beta
LRFFPLQAIPLSRIIGLTKEEIQHFRVVLFYTCCGSERANVQFSSQIKKRIGRFYMAEVKKMTQTAIVRELAEITGVNNKVSKHYLETLAELAVRETKKNGVFIVPGIGRLVRAERKARVGRNPATGEAIKIPAKKVVKFRLAKSVKDAIVPPKVKK